MKKSLIVCSILFLTTSAFSLPLTESQLKKLEEIPIFKKNGAKLIVGDKSKKYIHVKGLAPTPQGNMGFDAFLLSGTDEVIFGAARNQKTGQPISLDIKMSDYEKQAALKMGDGKEKLYIFTDPECPFCVKLEAQLDKISQNRTLFIYPFPLSFHDNALGMTYYILSQKTNDDKVKALKFVSEGNKNEVLSAIEPFNIGKYKKAFTIAVGNIVSEIQKKNLDIAKLSEDEKTQLTLIYTYLESTKRDADIYPSVQAIINSGLIKDDAALTAGRRILAIADDVRKNGYEDVLDRAKKIANTLSVSGTPSVFNSKGELVNWPELVKQNNK
ncbi:MAG: thioredoxin fold domain-containing protein [Campylobacterales bacterium]|nr:thioredoxin fold domain-containing protein [Campylobacterales bacterium]